MAQISDIHMGDWMNAERLSDVVRAVNAQSPDLIAITGDFVTQDAGSHARDLIKGLSQLKARDGVVAVLGNHDYWSDPQVVRDVLVASGVRELANSVQTLQRGAAKLHIAGVDDIWEGRDRLDLVRAALPADGAAILLAHEPDFADESAAAGTIRSSSFPAIPTVAQIVAPFMGPLHVPRFGRRYPSGQYQVGEMIQYHQSWRGHDSPICPFQLPPRNDHLPSQYTTCLSVRGMR